MKIISALFMSLLLLITINGCNKGSVNPNIPRVVINITIDPNSTIYQPLNTPGGWLYLDEQAGIYIPYGSQGVIVYRMSMTEFKAYERQSPDSRFECCDENMQNCAKLIVGGNYPFVKDTCNGNLYQLLDGSLFTGEGLYPLIEYGAVYDGGLLHIFN
ncbi:MAG: hypothetical protein P8J47_01300 [Bacteroidales bacterium]|nr:hypothetical protein [Bacteroidales bacterium]|tara:strand:+ start:1742 stop:2215 length:474 start_codon:yes stop_codon:yes gene_type:complete